MCRHGAEHFVQRDRNRKAPLLYAPNMADATVYNYDERLSCKASQPNLEWETGNALGVDPCLGKGLDPRGAFRSGGLNFASDGDLSSRSIVWTAPYLHTCMHFDVFCRCSMQRQPQETQKVEKKQSGPFSNPVERVALPLPQPGSRVTREVHTILRTIPKVTRSLCYYGSMHQVSMMRGASDLSAFPPISTKHGVDFFSPTDHHCNLVNDTLLKKHSRNPEKT